MATGPQWTNEVGSEPSTPSRDPESREPFTPPPRNDSVELLVSSSKLLAQYMQSQGYHPVILCGTTRAGKTTLIASLCAYLQTSGTAEIALGEWAVDGSEASKDKLREAKKFYHNTVTYFHQGKPPARTDSVFPYIVPLEITPTGEPTSVTKPKKVRLALIDMRGELFKTTVTAEPDLQPTQLHDDVQALLRAFEPGVSMLYVAPTRIGDGYNTDGAGTPEPHKSAERVTDRIHEDPDDALLNAMNSYRAVRPRKTHDRHLFLLTKWDIITEGIDSIDFRDPPRGQVESFLRQDYGRSWSSYRTLQAAPESKWFMQHSACVVSGGDIIHKPSESYPDLARYAEVVWNWLYQGATATPGRPQGTVLFQRALRRRPGLLTRTLDRVLRRRR